MMKNNKNNDIENPKHTKDEVSSGEDTHGGDEPVKAIPGMSPMMKREETGETENSDASGDNNNNELKGIPSVNALIFDFNGSIGFVIGSSGFILSLYNANWLPYFRYGCIAWIWGCLAFAAPILASPAHVEDGKKYSCSDAGILMCLLLFIAGCILGGFFSEEQVLAWLVHINFLFVFGSFSLAIEPLCQVGYFLIRCATCSARLCETKLLGGNGDGKLSLNWDRVLELLAMSCFCVAGSFGGFGPNTKAIITGVYFWEVGSVFCFFRSILMWHARRVGLRRLPATNATKLHPLELSFFSTLAGFHFMQSFCVYCFPLFKTLSSGKLYLNGIRSSSVCTDVGYALFL